MAYFEIQWMVVKLVKRLLIGIGLIVVLGMVFFTIRFVTRDPLDLSLYPVAEDCRKEKDFLVDNNPPSDEQKQNVARKLVLYKSMKLRPGYHIAKQRATRGMHGSPIYCTNWFVPQIVDYQGVIIFGEFDYIKAFVVKDKDIENISELIYGKPNTSKYRGLYDEWKTQPKCPLKVNDITDICVLSMTNFPNINDGDKEVNQGKMFVYRYVIEPGSITSLYLYKLSSEEDKLKVEKVVRVMEYHAHLIVY